MNAMFRSLRFFNYRVWFIGAIVSNVGTWMQSTAQNWVVLTELTDLDATAVGVTMALQFAPPLLLVPITGWVADRFDRRKLLMLTQTLLMALGAALGVLILTDVLTLPIMYAFAAMFGVMTAFDNPARQAFVSDLVAHENMSNAVALNSASFNTARLIGPAVAGVLIVAVGTGWVFIINAATFLAMLTALAVMKVDQLTPRVRGSSAHRMSEGFRYVAKRPDLLVLFGMVFLLALFGMNFPIIASTMAIDFGHGADGFGMLSSVLAIGSLTGALLAARRAEARIRVVIFGAGLFAVAGFVSIFMPNYWLYAATLMFTGFSVVTMLTTANGVVQTTTDPALRGRVLALYMAILMGGTPIGAPIVGWVTDMWGPRAGILLGSIAALIAFAGGLTWMIASGRFSRTPGHRFRFDIEETRTISVIPPEEFSDALAQTAPIKIPVATSPHGTARAERVNGARPRAGASSEPKPREDVTT